MTKQNLFLRILSVVSLAGLLSSCGNGEAETPGRADGDAHYAVVTANPHATEAGLAVLAEGGTAIDAAIAIQAVLGLVEPQSSGLGGGAFMLYYDAASGEVTAFDGREMAPASVRPDYFLNDDGTPVSFYDVVATGRSVGVPGVVAMLADAHADYGQMDWARLVAPVRQLAEDGFEISPRLSALAGLAPWTAAMPDARGYLFGEDGAPLPPGTVLRNPDYAETLRTLATDGPGAFYEGGIAEAIVERVRTAPTTPGAMTLADLANYHPVRREAVCGSYRSYRICGMGPPSSGGVTVQMILSLLEPYDMAALAPNSAEAVHLISEASHLAYADRAMYLADADFVAVPVAGLLDQDYLGERGARIDPERTMGVAEAGDPWPEEYRPRARDVTPDVPGTSHFVVVDAQGNAVSMTTSVESIFGSNLLAGGFFLNNQLTDFSFEVQRNGAPIANAPAPGKRPRSSMAPTMIFAPDGSLYAMVGSAGGSRIPAYVVQSIVALIDWDMSMEEAVNLPHHVNRNGATDLESGTEIEGIAEALGGMGHAVNITRLNSGTHGLRVTQDGIDLGIDQRREGAGATNLDVARGFQAAE